MTQCSILSLILIVSQIIRITASDLDYSDVGRELMQVFDRPTSKAWDIDAWHALQNLNTTLFKYIEYQQSVGLADSREEVINSRLGVFLFTRFCGPGGKVLNKFFNTDERTYSQIDVCCRFHDECPDYVTSYKDYSNYPGLEHRRQFFSR